MENKDEKVEVVKVVAEPKLSAEAQAVKDDADLIIALETQQDELMMEDRLMLHALRQADQMRKDLAKKQASTWKDPLVIAGLKIAVVEADLELEEERKSYKAYKDLAVRREAVK